jgi:hypothetical protein
MHVPTMRKPIKPYKFIFPFFVSEHTISLNDIIYSAKFRLDPFAYFLIWFYHGEQKLMEMSAQVYLEKELEGYNAD